MTGSAPNDAKPILCVIKKQNGINKMNIIQQLDREQPKEDGLL